MSSAFKISFAGAGNVAHNLAPAFENTGIKVQQVYSRNILHARQLTQKLYDAKPLDLPDFSLSDSDIIFISVPDDAIESLAAQIVIPKKTVVVHTSGAGSIHLLNRFEHHGVVYPLQTFSKEKKVNFEEIPFFIEASDSVVLNLLKSLTSHISRHIYEAESAKRLSLHVAAVFACNFTNHLYSISEDILQENGLTLDVLKPLVYETLEKSFQLGPASAQTGPAIRKDIKTLEKHLSFLSGNPGFKNLYKTLTKRILKKA